MSSVFLRAILSVLGGSKLVEVNVRVLALVWVPIFQTQLQPDPLTKQRRVIHCPHSKMKKITAHLVGCFAAVSILYAEAPEWQQVPEILSRIVAPKFPARDFVITKFGAVAD